MKAKKKDLLKRIEELEKSVRLLMDIQANNTLKEMKRLEILANVSNSASDSRHKQTSPKR